MNRCKLLCALAIVAIGGTAPGASGGIDAKAAFAQLKQLEGVWEAKSKEGSVSRSEFELTGNGTVLLERFSNSAMPGNGRMATAYHLDGADLVLTHYCMANNQPVLRAERFDAAAKEIQFEFVRAGNLATPTSGHMRRAMYRIVDADHFVTEWEFFENGKKKFTETESFTRVKR